MKKIVFAVTAVLMGSLAWAQAPMTLEAYRQKVVDYSQELKKAKETTSAATSNISAVRTGFLPKLDASADFNYQLHKMKFDLGPMGAMGFKQYGYGATATLSQNIYSGSAVRNQYNAARINQEIAQSAEQLTIDNIIYAADVSYWNVSASVSILDAAKRYVEIVSNLYAIVKDRFEDGLISRTDLLMVETRMKEAQFQYSSADKGFKSAVINLNVLMGAPVDAPQYVADSIEMVVPMPAFVTVEQAMSSRADYLIADKTVSLQNEQLKLSKAEFRPQVAVGFNGTYGTQSLNIDGKGIWNGIAFAQLKIPIFDWNKRRHTTSAARAGLRSSEYQRQNVADQVSKELNTAWSNLNESATQLSVAQSSLAIAEESLYLNTFSYNEGRLTILDVLTAQLSWLQAYNSLISSNFNYKMSLSDYNKAIGLYSN